MNPKADIFAKTDPLPPSEHQQYRTIVGKLLYAARLTRPDISISVNLLGRFLEHPTKAQWCALMHLIEFIRATKDMFLELRPDGDSVRAYSDADIEILLSLGPLKSKNASLPPHWKVNTSPWQMPQEMHFTQRKWQNTSR